MRAFRQAVRSGAIPFSGKVRKTAWRLKADELWRLKWRKLSLPGDFEHYFYSDRRGRLGQRSLAGARYGYQSQRYCEYTKADAGADRGLRAVCALLAAFIGR